MPASSGEGFAYSPILKPLEPHRDRLTLVSGLYGGPTVLNGGHAVAPASYLTGNIQPKQTETADVLNGVTIDQVIAKAVGQDTPFPSLEVATEDFSTSIGACDPIDAVADVAQRHGLYLHVDAAWAGSAMICPEFRELWKGVEAADSIVFNPHKWLGAQFDCSVQFIRNPEDQVRTLAIQPEYLKTHGHDGIINFSEWSVPLGRRFRALVHRRPEIGAAGQQRDTCGGSEPGKAARALGRHDPGSGSKGYGHGAILRACAAGGTHWRAVATEVCLYCGARGRALQPRSASGEIRCSRPCMGT